MGICYRKSIKLGCGFRINLSKSGIGYSWGVPGYRITKLSNGKTRTTVSIPRTGISYVEDSTNCKRKVAPQDFIETDTMHEIESADIKQFQSAEYADLITQFEKIIKLKNISTKLFWCTLLGFIIPPLLILPMVGIIIRLLLHTKYRINMEYSFQDNTQALFEKKVSSWLILNSKLDLLNIR